MHLSIRVDYIIATSSRADGGMTVSRRVSPPSQAGGRSWLARLCLETEADPAPPTSDDDGQMRSTRTPPLSRANGEPMTRAPPRSRTDGETRLTSAPPPSRADGWMRSARAASVSVQQIIALREPAAIDRGRARVSRRYGETRRAPSPPPDGAGTAFAAAAP
eukprot:CAMPEP_0172572300 /NCGR_PEP_ID=MMETSP1067-20121228/134614_1 /TAXON_ID=265564 ORGANISM="Thalassiosira punctigera, Strain Tpunct2005C2" /NCGR_SAMPLE_ID=MMETSP1067 /ASSEMBLY_ACC=CAM_ASM_000444 /LENGTH=161 /DNA_ID=CAMNT_0013364811 /DNA_START=260 /DNA_END=745 /DNA_ORIENTATION=-